MFKGLTDAINELRAIRLSRKGAKAAQAGDFGACEELYRRGLAIMYRTFGNVKGTAAYTLALGRLLVMQDRLEEAVPFFERTLVILEEAQEPDHLHVAESLNCLADIYSTQGKCAEAEPLYKRSLAILERVLGPEHPDVATILENYASLLRQTVRADEAERMEARAEAIRVKSE